MSYAKVPFKKTKQNALEYKSSKIWAKLWRTSQSLAERYEQRIKYVKTLPCWEIRTLRKRDVSSSHMCVNSRVTALTTNKTLTSDSRVYREGSVKNNQVPLTAAQHEQVQRPPGTSLELSVRQRARGPTKTQKYPLDAGVQSLCVSSRSYQPVAIKTRSLGGSFSLAREPVKMQIPGPHAEPGTLHGHRSVLWLQAPSSRTNPGTQSGLSVGLGSSRGNGVSLDLPFLIDEDADPITWHVHWSKTDMTQMILPQRNGRDICPGEERTPEVKAVPPCDAVTSCAPNLIMLPWHH